MTTTLKYFVALIALSVPVLGAPPDNAGPVKLIAASFLGGGGKDEIVSVGFDADGSILLAGNALDPAAPAGVKVVTLSHGSTRVADAGKKKDKNAPDPGSSGLIWRLSADGGKLLSLTRFDGLLIRKMRVAGRWGVFLLADAPNSAQFIKGEIKGTFVAQLLSATEHPNSVLARPGAIDFDADATSGDTVVLTKGTLTRYDMTSRQLWAASFSAQGDNRPGGVALSPGGVAAVTGYGMTHTGKEPYKDPYAYAFDKDGKQVWRLWNPDPKLEVAAKFGGNGLMADTTGRFAASTADGKVLLSLFADGGNSVCTRDPQNPGTPLSPKVFDGVFQKGPGYGFKGASKTAVIFRVDSATGKIEKGTWMCAWLTKSQANGLGMAAATGDAAGHVFVVGNSAAGCPTEHPWYEAPPGGYTGGGFLAVFDKEFKMLQCGYFPGTTIKAVALHDDTIVIAGSAVAENKAKDPASGQETTYHTPSQNPVQPNYGGGDKDGWFAVLKLQK